ncbi:MAG: hypothetical protein RL497_2474 [Pseudomonadota bacterium]|jgi:hypothetical protein
MNKKYCLLACGLFFLSSGIYAEAPLISEEDERLVLQLGAGAATRGRAVCDGKGIPDGWITVDKASPMVCGISGVGSAAGFSAVVPIIERYSNKPVGAVMEVCYGSVPKGWKKISEGHSSWLCGGSPFDFPLTSGASNVMEIKKKKPKNK